MTTLPKLISPTQLNEEEEEEEEDLTFNSHWSIQEEFQLLEELRLSQGDRKLKLASHIIKTITTRPITLIGDFFSTILPLYHTPSSDPETYYVALTLTSAILTTEAHLTLGLRLTLYTKLREPELYTKYPQLVTEVIKLLTNQGRHLEGFERDWLPFLGDLLLTPVPHSLLLSHQLQLLTLLSSTLKFNFSNLNSTEIHHLFQLLVTLSTSDQFPSLATGILEVMDVIVRYGFVHEECLPHYLRLGCYLSTVLPWDSVWDVISNLFRSHCAFQGVSHLCTTLEDHPQDDPPYCVAAMNLLAAVLWGPKRIPSLRFPTYAILTSIQVSCTSRVPEIHRGAIPVLLGFLQSQSSDTNYIEWDSILTTLTITSTLLEFQLVSTPTADSTPKFPVLDSVWDSFLTLLTFTLNLITQSKFHGNLTRFRNLIRPYLPTLPIHLTRPLLKLDDTMNYFIPSDPDWLDHLTQLMGYCLSSTSPTDEKDSVNEEEEEKEEGELPIPLVMLDIVTRSYHATKEFYLPELVSTLLLPLITWLPSQSDPKVLVRIYSLLLDAISLGETPTRLTIIQHLLPDLPTNLTEDPPSANLDFDPSSDSDSNSEGSFQYHPIGTSDSLLPDHRSVCESLLLIFLLETLLVSPDPSGCPQVYHMLLHHTAVTSHPTAKIWSLQFLTSLRADTQYLYLKSPPLSLSTAEGLLHHILVGAPLPELARRGWSGAPFDSQLSTYHPQNSHNDRQWDRTSDSLPLRYRDGEIRLNTQLEVPHLPITQYLPLVLLILDQESHWSILACLLRDLPCQLANVTLFWSSPSSITTFRHRLYAWITNATFLRQLLPLPDTIKRGDLFVAAYRCLHSLIGYRPFFTKSDRDEMVLAFQLGLHKWAATARSCIHALTICGFEFQLSMTKLLPSTLVKLSQIMSTSTISVHILEFLSCLARSPDLYANLVDADFKCIFGIALQYIQYNSTNLVSPQATLRLTSPSNTIRAGMGVADEQAHLQYVLILAYHVIARWFVNLRLVDRRKFIPFIVRGLELANANKPTLDEQTETCLDMLARYAFSTCHSQFHVDPFIKEFLGMSPGSQVITRTWIRGDILLTVEAAPPLKWAHVIVRRSSATISWMVELEPDWIEGMTIEETLPNLLVAIWDVEGQRLINHELGQSSAPVSSKSGVGKRPPRPMDPPPPPELPSDLPLNPEPVDGDAHSATRMLFEQKKIPVASRNTKFGEGRESQYFDSGFFYLDIKISQPPQFHPIPEEDFARRALGVLDRMPVVDFHKVGVIYVAPGQTNELEILSNSAGSLGYHQMVQGLGELVPLRGCRDFYTGGLDTEMDIDGTHTMAWSDGLSQLIFHVATMMPTRLTTDPQCSGKKRHIGNDYVTVVYNDGGTPYSFSTLPGQFNLVNLIVTPLPTPPNTDPLYLVQSQLRPDLPDLSPLLHPHLITAPQLPSLLRPLALHLVVVAQIFLRHGQYATHWCERLRQIRRLGQRYPPPTLTTKVGDILTAHSADHQPHHP